MRAWARTTSRWLLFIAASLIVGTVWGAPLDKIHFLIPGAPGGGWDGTARGIGEALVKSELIASVSYENLSGGGGGRAIAKLIETARRQQGTLMVNSTPIVVRSLQKVFPQSFRDLTPIASVIADYSCLVVDRDSTIAKFEDAVERFRATPRDLRVAGGSVRGSTDHLVAAKILRLLGEDPKRLVYIPYDAGGKAMAGLLSGETHLLSTGLSETIDLARAGEVRILAVASPERMAAIPDVPTLRELGVEMEFANWRGFFAPPGIDAQRRDHFIRTLERLVETPAFEEVRRRNGWTVQLLSGGDFMAFLARQETEIGTMMRELGFLR